MPDISISVPARICFFGDHQDYLGLPVIAGTIDRYIQLVAKPNGRNEFVVRLCDLDKTQTIALDRDFGEIDKDDYLRSGMAVLNNHGFDFKKGYDIEIQGNIPLNAGLSSSSALVVAWVRFLMAAQTSNKTAENKQIGHWAYEAEVLFFGQPGGLMDQYTIAQGGLLYIDTNSGGTTKLQGDLGNLIIAESGISKKTLEVLKNGRIYGQRTIAAIKQKYPDFDIKKATVEEYEKYKDVVPEAYRPYWYAAIHNYDITLKAKVELEKRDSEIKMLGKLMDAHQNILQNQIRNTPPAMVNMMEAARDAGAFGTKIIGSGGGGCMVAITSESGKQKVIDAFISAGAVAAYEAKLTIG
ncbi:MAG: GHMP kinase [Muricauda sp.]|nr:GHMP kinase [Allomuricauda sp.]MBC31581.1 GHMP kinase [Allomuricauda sp.]|tara:strand:- start:33755 stop:34816 length:1062 start_codon:yes stop_codon:yes gene_type:complete